MGPQELEKQIQDVNSHIHETESFVRLLNSIQISGSQSGTVERMKRYFDSVNKQLESQLEQLAQLKNRALENNSNE